MEEILRYRGRIVTNVDLEFIRELIANNPGLSRRKLSEKLCEAWDWRQANGSLRAMVCRGLMLQLHRGGYIELPPVKQVSANPLARCAAERRKLVLVAVDTSPFCGSLADCKPLEIRQVRRTEEEGLFDSLLEQYHYLGYLQPVGEHLKYLVYAKGRPIACLAWSSAPRHLGARDRFIGWSAEARRKNIHFIAYNTRFLILPFVAIPHLASHILGRMTRILPEEWKRVYAHPVYFLETFIDPERFRGTCYLAANWVVMGKTKGLGKDSRSIKPNRSIKNILGYALRKDFRQLLAKVELP